MLALFIGALMNAPLLMAPLLKDTMEETVYGIVTQGMRFEPKTTDLCRPTYSLNIIYPFSIYSARSAD